MFYRRSGRADVPPGVTAAQHNRRELKALVDGGTVPGLIGYRAGKPIAWISFGPRVEFAKLAKSPVMKPVDAKPVWSVVCFFISTEARGQGVSGTMLEHAAAFARKHGATLLEAYPVDKPVRDRDDSMWFGAKSLYDRAGFREVARRTPTRPVVRKALRSICGQALARRRPRATPPSRRSRVHARAQAASPLRSARLTSAPPSISAFIVATGVRRRRPARSIRSARSSRGC
jgi:GNAT superfamily N-acetyltransferase